MRALKRTGTQCCCSAATRRRARARPGARLLQAHAHKVAERGAEGALQLGRRVLGDQEQHAHGVQVRMRRRARRQLRTARTVSQVPGGAVRSSPCLC